MTQAIAALKRFGRTMVALASMSNGISFNDLLGGTLPAHTRSVSGSRSNWSPKLGALQQRYYRCHEVLPLPCPAVRPQLTSSRPLADRAA